MSSSPPPGMPSTAAASDARPQRAPDRWRTAGLALLAVWSALIVVVILGWVRASFFTDVTENPEGSIRVYGAPFVLVALGLLWWVWWSARALRRGRHEGWPVLIVLGLGSVALTVMTVSTVVGVNAMGSGTPGYEAEPLRELYVSSIVPIAFGLLSVVVAGLALRAWAASDAADSPAGPATTERLSDRG